LAIWLVDIEVQLDVIASFVNGGIVAEPDFIGLLRIVKAKNVLSHLLI
jgi:hypothetical protein